MNNDYFNLLRNSIARCSKLDNAKSVYECGVFRGLSAGIIAEALEDTQIELKLFDTFSGIPHASKEDNMHCVGDFSNTSIELVKEKLSCYRNVSYHVGRIPDTFDLADKNICFAHLDVDVYQSYVDCLSFLNERMCIDGEIICHDYNYGSCLGANQAIDEFLLNNKNYNIFFVRNGTGDEKSIGFKRLS